MGLHLTMRGGGGRNKKKFIVLYTNRYGRLHSCRGSWLLVPGCAPGSFELTGGFFPLLSQGISLIFLSAQPFGYRILNFTHISGLLDKECYLNIYLVPKVPKSIAAVGILNVSQISTFKGLVPPVVHWEVEPNGRGDVFSLFGIYS